MPGGADANIFVTIRRQSSAAAGQMNLAARQAAGQMNQAASQVNQATLAPLLSTIKRTVPSGFPGSQKKSPSQSDLATAEQLQIEQIQTLCQTNGTSQPDILLCRAHGPECRLSCSPGYIQALDLGPVETLPSEVTSFARCRIGTSKDQMPEGS